MFFKFHSWVDPRRLYGRGGNYAMTLICRDVVCWSGLKVRCTVCLIEQNISSWFEQLRISYSNAEAFKVDKTVV